MAIILENRPVAHGIYLMRIKGAAPGQAGQFYMLAMPDALDPFLGRPISLFDCEGDVCAFLYQSIGRGTSLFSRMLVGQCIEAQGPYGNGFALIPGDIALIGGGIGIAPLYLLARMLRKTDASRRITAYLGFRDEAYMEDAFCSVADEVVLNIGGFVTNDVDFSLPRTYYACGPEPMLRAAAKSAGDAVLYVSLEQHMACGVGACLGCTCKTKRGNRRVCKDGPVFLSTEAYYEPS